MQEDDFSFTEENLNGRDEGNPIVETQDYNPDQPMPLHSSKMQCPICKKEI